MVIGLLFLPLTVHSAPIQAAVPQAGAEPIIRIFEVKHVDSNQLKSILSVFPAEISVGRPGRTYVLSVKATTPVMDAIEETIKRLDVPPAPLPPSPAAEQTKIAELAIYVIVPTEAPGNNPLPPALKPVVDQINTLFKYKGFLLLDTVLVRAPASRPGEGSSQPSVSGTLPIPAAGTSTYTFNANFSLRSTDRGEPYLYLRGMGFTVKVPRVANPSSPEQFYTVGISSDVEIRPGQHVVVGKTQVGGTSIILVMSARFLDPQSGAALDTQR